MPVRRRITRALCAVVAFMVVPALGLQGALPAQAVVDASPGAASSPAVRPGGASGSEAAARGPAVAPGRAAATAPGPAAAAAAGVAATAAAAEPVEHTGVATPLPAGQLEAVITLRTPSTGRPAPAAAPGEVSTVLRWAAGHGLTVRHQGPFHVLLAGSRATLAAAFGVRLARTRSALDAGAGAAFVAPVSRPTVPAALAGAAQAVFGLDDRPVARPATSASYVPTQLRSIAAQPIRLAAGAGITVATLQFSGWTLSQATEYASLHGIPLRSGQISTVSVDGAPPDTPDGQGGDLEAALDVESILAMAPAARQRVYIADNSVAGMIDVYATMAADARAGLIQAASSSWGACENDYTSALMAQLETSIDQMVAAGATFFAATGDSGSDGCAGVGPVDQVWFPASLPEAVAVGGTRHDPVTNAETAWSGSGGGQSSVYPVPGYQSGITVPLAAGGDLAPTGRLVPDVASLGDPETGALIVDSVGQQTVGGTSLAAPLSAGALATALAAAGRSTGLGDIHAALYAHASDFTDVTAGSTNGTYSPGTGFDAVTGLGVPRWSRLTADLGLTALPLAAYHPVNPVRLLDTRTGLGTGVVRKLGQGGTLRLVVAGAGGLPGSGVAAVVLNITAVDATVATNVEAYPTGFSDGSTTSALNVVPGATVANLVTTKVAADGSVTIRNAGGSLDIVADVQGWYARDSGLGYHPVTPVRVLDTRGHAGSGTGITALGAGAALVLDIEGHAGVPTTGVQAVALNVTATRATHATFLSVYPTDDTAGRASSNVNAAPGQDAANLVISKVAPDGTVTISNSGAGTLDVVADLQGWYAAGGGQLLEPLDPGRVLDTRIGLGGPLGPVLATHDLFARVSEASVGVAAAVMNLTGVAATEATYLRIWPTGTPLPPISSLNLAAGQTRANLTMTLDPAGGTLAVHNLAGGVFVLGDLDGYFGTQSG